MSADFNEALLHSFWASGYLLKDELRTTTGQTLTIVKPGTLNTDAGPDFTEAVIAIDGLRWLGNIEMHLSSSDWHKHGHLNDAAYDNVILHVVYSDDKLVRDGLNTLELSQFFNRNQLKLITDKFSDNRWVSCEDSISTVPQNLLIQIQTDMLRERLNAKVEMVLGMLSITRMDWQEVLYQLIGRAFGFRTNSTAFEMLVRRTPYNIIRKVCHDPDLTAALLFGQSGLVGESGERDKYVFLLEEQYKWLRLKFHLDPMPAQCWKFSRMRPRNFPTIRIAQFADLLVDQQDMLVELLNAKSIDDIRKLINAEAKGYWRNHYRFGLSSEESIKPLGKSASDLIISNAVIPFLLTYARQRGRKNLEGLTYEIIEQLPSEQDVITKNWRRLGLKTSTAGQSQALHQLYTAHCKYKKCLNCAIGKYLVDSP